MFLCTYCSSVNVYLLFLCSSVLLFVCSSEPAVSLRSIGGFHVTQVSLIITQVKNKIGYHSINWVKKLKYRRRVINKRAKVSGMHDIPNSSYSANHWKLECVSMETPCWSPSDEALQHGDCKSEETSWVYFGSLKTFLLSAAKLKHIRIGTSLNIFVTQNSKTQGELTFSCT